MVRLKDPMFALQADSSVFQFHYGTIKSLSQPDCIRIRPKFQFHYGTIKREIYRMGRENRIGFQFHYGTIKRDMQPNYAIH